MKLSIVFLALLSQMSFEKGAYAQVNRTGQIRQTIDSVADKVYNGFVAVLQSQNITVQSDYRHAVDRVADTVFNGVLSASSFLERSNVTASSGHKPLGRDQLAAVTAEAIALRNRYTIDYVVDSVYKGVVTAAAQGKASYEWFNRGSPYSTDVGHAIRNKLQLLFPDSEVRYLHNTYSVRWFSVST